MSRKRGGLRLKKRTESSVLDSTAAGSVHVTTDSNEFKRVGLSWETRVSLHKLLLGENPEPFTPFPPSKLCLDSATEERPPAYIAKHITEERDREDKEKLKWTPLPPPNVMAILGKMPLVPLTMEQLCAPISDEEDEEADEIEQEGEYKKDFIFQDRSPSTVPTIDNDERVTSGRSGENPSSVPTIKTVSNFIKSSRTNHKPGNSNESQRNSNQPLSLHSKSSEEMQQKRFDHDVIDLTDSSNQPSTSIHHSNRALHTHTTSACFNSRTCNSTSQTEEFKTKDDDDFDMLCTDVDLDIIDDFSDEDLEISLVHNAHCATSGKGNLSYNEQQNVLRSSEIHYSKGKSSISGSPNLKKGTVTTCTSSGPTAPNSSTTKHDVSQPKTAYSSAAVNSKKKCTGIKRSSDLNLVSQIKHPRLETGEEQSLVEDVSATSVSNIEHPCSPSSGTVSPLTATSGDQRLDSTTHGLMTQTTVTGTGGRKRQTISGHRDTTHVPVATGFDSSPRPSSVSTAQSALPTTSREDVAISSRGAGVGHTTPLGHQLASENCPICNEKFSSWYEQVDADRHIAQCLQAVMNLEEENLVLFS